MKKADQEALENQQEADLSEATESTDEPVEQEVPEAEALELSELEEQAPKKSLGDRIKEWRSNCAEKREARRAARQERKAMWQGQEEITGVEVRLEGLTKIFVDKTGRETRAVDNFDLVIPAGKLIGLLGPSGCGKSTMLFMIAGLHKPTDGKIFFGEDDVTLMAPERRGIGLVFQNYALYPHMTVRQNILFPLENMKVPKEEAEELAQQYAELVHIGDLMDRKPSQLSGGQQQRVAIARALVKKPRVLLLDEPLSNLDARLRLQMREEIRRIQVKTGITTIFVTHDQEEAMSISDEIVLMNYGVFQQRQAPQYIYDNPKNLFVAKFLGNPPINLQSGFIKGGKLYLNNGIELEKVNAEDQEVFIGFRPEFFQVLENDKNGKVPVIIRIVEHIGRDTMAVVEILDQDKVAPRATLYETIVQERAQALEAEQSVAEDLDEEHLEEQHEEHKKRQPKQVKVTFFTDGGSLIDDVTLDKGQPVERPLVNPTRAGGTFRRWLLNGRPYNFDEPVESDLTLVAEYEKTSMRIVVNENRDLLEVNKQMKLGYSNLFIFNADTGERIK